MRAGELWKSNEFGDFYRFRNLTLFPFDQSLIEWKIITPEEKEWLDAYHREVYDRLSPLISAEEAEWLSHQCKMQNS